MSEIPELLEVLHECWEYFDNRSDADHDGDGFVPNAEMRLMCRCDEAIKIVEKLFHSQALPISKPKATKDATA